MIRSIIRPETWVSCGYDGAYFWLHKSTYTEVGVTGGHEYRTRIAFRAPRMSLGGGKNVTVSQAVLRLTSVTDASNTLTAQSTYGANWGFSDTWATYPVTITGNTTTETDVTPPAEIAETFGSWDDYVYYHLSYVADGDNTLVRLASYDTATTPELIVTWDYAENTIHTDTVEATAGVTSVTWTITPGADDARYVLAYRLGTATGTVYDGSGTSITWTPPYSVAEGIPDAASGQMELTLAVYDSDGALLRQETTYLAINTRAARNVKFRTLSYDGSEPVVMDGLVTYYLGGETEMKVGITLTDTYADGATPVSVRFSLALDGWTSEAVWTASEMTKSGDEWTLPSKSMGIPPTGGTYAMSYTVTDTRGHVDSTSSLTLSIQDYARPSIPLFSAERYGEIIDDDQHVIGYQTDPTGNKVWFSASAAIASVNGVNAMNWVLTLTSRADGTVLTASGTATGTSLTWSNDLNLIGDTIDPEIVWDAALAVTDSAGFTATAYDVVPAGKAVLHLPACKNGIAFGGLSTATSDNPLGEMFYPFHAYAGIYGVTGWSLKEEDTGGVWLDGQKVYRKTLYARIATAGQAVDIPFPDGLQRIVHMQGILYTDDTINRTRPLSWYYNASLNASLWHGGGAYVTVQANGEIGDAFVTIWYTKAAGIVITQQPEDATVALGGTATFTVAALGSPAYQWQKLEPVRASVGPVEVAHVTDALHAAADAVTVEMEITQSGSGDPSPTNIRPITAWTGANITVGRTQASGAAVAVSFGRTVCCGMLDAAAGTLTFDWKIVTINDLTWSYSSSNRRFQSTGISDAERGHTIRTLPVMCSAFTPVSDGRTTSTVPADAIYGISTSTPTIYIGTTLYTTQAALKAAMGDQTIAYPLETPVTVNLTPAAVTLLAGENYVWTDCGEITLTYATDADGGVWADVSGEMAASMSVTATLEETGNRYRCQLTDGSAAATSDAAGIVIQ